MLASSLNGLEGLAILVFLLLVLPLMVGLLLGMLGIIIALISKRPHQASRFLGYGAMLIGVLTLIPIGYRFFVLQTLWRPGAIFDVVYLLPSIVSTALGLLSVKLWSRKRRAKM